MVSRGHIWEERISANPFLTHYLVRGIGDAMFGSETERKWSFQGGKKITKEKPVSQNAVCGKSFS